jgi:hypothetical protein
VPGITFLSELFKGTDLYILIQETGSTKLWHVNYEQFQINVKLKNSYTETKSVEGLELKYLEKILYIRLQEEYENIVTPLEKVKTLILVQLLQVS